MLGKPTEMPRRMRLDFRTASIIVASTRSSSDGIAYTFRRQNAGVRSASAHAGHCMQSTPA
jgi:hypothetical protein